VGRCKFIAIDKASPHSLIFYESPYRLEGFLRDALQTLGDREAAIANDLTKMFEKVQRGTLSSLLEAVTQSKPRGEYIIVIAGMGKGDIEGEDNHP
jgi:16S rRNA (cytidine1402-2'-O)-methyltransferase